MTIDRRFVADCSLLIFNIKVIGYSSQGECIIFEIIDRSQEKVLYRGLIDSYCLKDLHVAFDYLRSIGAPPLDSLCWTHPDNDHSVGLLEIIENYCNGNTKFIIPATLDEKLNSNLDLSDYHKLIFDAMEVHWKMHPNNLVMISGGYGNRVEDIEFKDKKSNNVKFTIWGIAPHGGDIRMWREKSKERVKNILSVGLEIEFGCYRFIFSGDMPNESINEAYDAFFQDPVWLKIPHHGSKHSDAMVQKINYDSHNLFACTTVFNTHGLPKEEVLNSYLQKGGVRIDTTGTGEEKFGIIDYSFDLFNSQTVRISHTGNAKQYVIHS